MDPQAHADPGLRPPAAGPAIALIAHDARKQELLDLAARFRSELAGERLVATGTTRRMLAERLGLHLECVASGPRGGDLQIGALVAAGDVKLVVFLRDPLNPHPHEPDIQALFKVCDTHHVPLATNASTARLSLLALMRGDEPPLRAAAGHGPARAEAERAPASKTCEDERGAATMKILVGTDGSPTAARAVRVAARLAREVGGEVAVVTAYRQGGDARRRRARPGGTAAPHPQRSGPGKDVDSALAQARAICDDLGVEVESHAREGDPAGAILGMAREVDADLVVVGNRGMQGMRRLVGGSVPDRVSHHAPCNVMIVDTST